MTKLQFSAKGGDATLVGDIKESAVEGLQQLVRWASTRESGRIDVQGVRSINSSGTRLWLSALEKFDNRSFMLVRCSVDFVDAANMIGDLAGDLQVESLMAPLVCEPCGRQTEGLVDAVRRRLPPCATCGRPSTLAMDADDYFRFLK